MPLPNLHPSVFKKLVSHCGDMQSCPGPEEPFCNKLHATGLGEVPVHPGTLRHSETVGLLKGVIVLQKIPIASLATKHRTLPTTLAVFPRSGVKGKVWVAPVTINPGDLK